MNDVLRSALNRRGPGDDISDWEYDPDSASWRVTCEETATAVVPGPLATANLLATAHIGKLTEREKASADANTRQHIASLVAQVLDKLHDQVWTAIGTLAAQGCTYYENTELHEPRAEATKRMALAAADSTPDIVASQLLRQWATGESDSAARHVSFEWLPLARLSHTSVPVDPDNVPRFERDLHHADDKGKADDLHQLLSLTMAALTSDDAAAMWASMVKYENVREASQRFSQMAESTRPFGWPSGAVVDLIDAAATVASELCANMPQGIVAVAEPSAECDMRAPVVRMSGSHSDPAYAVGTAAYPFVEALVLAAQVLTHADPEPLPANRAVKRPRAAQAGVAVYACGLENVLGYLRSHFIGWHHSRCLEPRQTAHATVMGLEAMRVAEFFETTLHAHFEDRVHALYELLRHVDHPTLVSHPLFFVQGPGNGAVATVCKAVHWLAPTDHLKRLERELWGQLSSAARDLPRIRPPRCVAVQLGFPAPGVANAAQPARRSLAEIAQVADGESLACAVLELHTFDTIRADAGKRYRHTLGANAAAAALDTALRQLLLSPSVGG